MDKDTHHHRIDRPRLKRDEYRSLRECIREESIGVELGEGVKARRKGRNKRGSRKAGELREKAHLGGLEARKVCE